MFSGAGTPRCCGAPYEAYGPHGRRWSSAATGAALVNELGASGKYQV